MRGGTKYKTVKEARRGGGVGITVLFLVHQNKINTKIVSTNAKVNNMHLNFFFDLQNWMFGNGTDNPTNPKKNKETQTYGHDLAQRAKS